jgi:glycosyltransferase involved in cell wall biosynthesis
VRIAVCGISPESVHLRAHVEYLAAQGHQVTLLTNAPAPDLPVEVVDFFWRSKLRRITPPGLGLVPRLAALRAGLRRHDYDVLEVMQVTPDGVYAAMIWDGPLVLDFWGSDILRLADRPWWIRRLMPRAIAKADAIRSVSEQMTGVLVANGADPARIETFAHGIDLDVFSAAPARPGSRRIISTRGLRAFYRAETLIRAMPAVLAAEPRATLALTGAGAERAGLETLVAELGIADRVQFLGFAAREDVAAELQRAALWVSLPPSDGAPLSLLEAMACGAFPVMADTPALHDWISDDRGVFVDVVTAEGVAAGVLRAFELADRGTHSEAARRLVEERGDRAKNLPRWEAMLERAASTPDRRRHGTGRS